MLFKCVAFDVDGTLVDTFQASTASLQEVLLEEMGRAYTTEELQFTFGMTGVASLTRLGVPDVQTALAKWNAYIERYVHLVRAYPGIPEVLAELGNAGVTLGLVTSRTRAGLGRDLDRLGLLGHFRTTVCADDTRNHKPAPDPLLKLLADTGLAPADVLYVGDTVYDSECARAAGVRFALALWGAADPAVPCDYRVERPEDLLRLCGQTP